MTKRKAKDMSVADAFGPTAERLERAREAGSVLRKVETTDAGVFAWYEDGCTVLARYLRRKNIDQREYDAGCRLHEDWTTAGLEPCVISSYRDLISSGSVASDSLRWSEVREAAYKRFKRAMRLLGPVACKDVVSCCIFDELVGVDGLVILRRGLKVLADDYGLPT